MGISIDVSQPEGKKQMATTEQATRTDILVVGSGFGGVGAHLYLEKEWGVKNFIIVEKESNVGGIWWKNTYPGVACDVPPQLYSYSRDIDPTPIRYPNQRSTLGYLEGLPGRHNLDRGHLRFNARVYALDYNDRMGEWTAKTKNVGTDGETEGSVYVAKFVILAAGQLDEPFVPGIIGQEVFQGPAFHTARWDHDQDLRGKKVAVIGTGPSATQLIPEIAKIAQNVTIYQRTPNWVLPRPSAEFGPITKWALKNSTKAQRLYRVGAYWLADFLLSPITSRGWSAGPLEWVARRQLRKQVPDRALREKVTPDFPLGCKRFILSQDYYPALMRGNVELVTDPIKEIVATGIVTDTNTLREADIIVYATGFHTTEFYKNMDIRGRGGRSLKEDIWENGQEAYLGVAFEGLPNLAALHGPGSFTAAGSNVIMKEHQLHLIGNMLKLLWSWKNAAIEVLPETMERYRRERDEIIRNSVLLGCDSWYRDKQTGQVVNPYGRSMWSFRRQTRRNPREDFGPISLTGE